MTLEQIKAEAREDFINRLTYVRDIHGDPEDAHNLTFHGTESDVNTTLKYLGHIIEFAYQEGFQLGWKDGHAEAVEEIINALTALIKALNKTTSPESLGKQLKELLHNEEAMLRIAKQATEDQQNKMKEFSSPAMLG
jgi:flagellar biosynthesis/type III secretory pathway protein FliH